MENNSKKTSAYLLNGKQEPAGGPTSLALATLTLGIVAVIAVSGLIV
ncbi:hypothetical protein [Haliea sp. E17]